MIEFPVFYVTKKQKTPGRIRLDDGGAAMLFGHGRSGQFSWSQLTRISFDDPGRTKASLGMIAVFGVLGLAARKTFTLMTLSTGDQDMYFELDQVVGAWRGAAERIIRDIASAEGKVFVDGALVGEAPALPATAETADVFDQIRKLGELRDGGLITAEEFETKKTELLSRM